MAMTASPPLSLMKTAGALALGLIKNDDEPGQRILIQIGANEAISGSTPDIYKYAWTQVSFKGSDDDFAIDTSGSGLLSGTLADNPAINADEARHSGGTTVGIIPLVSGDIVEAEAYATTGGGTVWVFDKSLVGSDDSPQDLTSVSISETLDSGTFSRVTTPGAWKISPVFRLAYDASNNEVEQVQRVVTYDRRGQYSQHGEETSAIVFDIDTDVCPCGTGP
jgi:hypothetical protein